MLRQSLAYSLHLIASLAVLFVYNVYIRFTDRMGIEMSQSETVTVRLSAEVKQKLVALSISTNRSKSWLAAQAISAYVEEQSWQIQQIEEAMKLADSGVSVWVEGESVNAWLNSWGTETENSVPCV